MWHEPDKRDSGIVMAMQPGDKPPVKGKVEQATAFLYGHSRLIKYEEIPLDQVPYHLNNMTDWFQLAVRLLGGVQLFWASKHIDDVKFTVNEGRGALRGSAGYQNTFTYAFRGQDEQDYSVEVKILTVSHQNLYYHAVRTGKRQRKAKFQHENKPYVYKGSLWVPMQGVPLSPTAIGSGWGAQYPNTLEGFAQAAIHYPEVCGHMTWADVQWRKAD